MGDGQKVVAGLGRPFSLGMLYDSRKDELVAGITLWTSQTLAANIQRTLLPSTPKAEYITSDDIQSKASALDISASLKLSLLGGLVNLSGSGKYFEDHQSSSQVSRVTMNYRTTVKFEQLSMDQLNQKGIEFPHVFDQGVGTHVVTGITYGADAFFVFEQAVSSGQSKTVVQGSLQAAVKTLGAKIQGDANVHFTEDELKKVENINCSFYGDFIADYFPTNFVQAIDMVKNLPQKLKENPVPKTVYLMPLTQLDSKAAKLVREISLRLIDRVQGLMQTFWSLTAEANDLKADNAYGMLTGEVEKFLRLLGLAKDNFVKQIHPVISKIRGDINAEGEQELLDIVMRWEAATVSPSNFQKTLDSIRRSSKFMKSILDDPLAQGIKMDNDIPFLVSQHDFLVALIINPEGIANKRLLEIESRSNDMMQKPSEDKDLTEWFDVSYPGQDPSEMKLLQFLVKNYVSYYKAIRDGSDYHSASSIPWFLMYLRDKKYREDKPTFVIAQRILEGYPIYKPPMMVAGYFDGNLGNPWFVDASRIYFKD